MSGTKLPQARTKVPIPRAIQRWYQDPITVSRLREILAEDAFQVAQATLLDAALPTYASLNRPAENNSLRHAWLAGYRDAMRDLQALTIAPASRAQNPLPDEWGHLTDDLTA
jgi:ribosome modulation factor